MRNKTLVLIPVVLAMLAGVASAVPTIGVSNRKFDHARHDASSKAKGKVTECTQCHVMNAKGEPVAGRDHARCNSCHGPRGGGDMRSITNCEVMKTTGAGGPARVCAVCHTPTRPQCLPGDLPGPFRGASPFAPQFAHQKHIGLSGFAAKCAQCHKEQAPVAPAAKAGHSLCNGCHNSTGARPNMAECARCHMGGGAKTAPVNDPFRLNGFQHKSHHTISKQADCQGCHTKMSDAQLPRPAMASCMANGCHVDGGKAFSAVGTQCTKCHKGTGGATATRTDLAFNHSEHAKRNTKIADCNGCHPIDTTGALAAPLQGKDHQPCAASGCHLNEFLGRTNKICGVCHASSSPWAKNPARYKEGSPDKPSEYFETINHVKHLTELKGSTNDVCEKCHGEKLAGKGKPAPHGACVSCHGRGTKPEMTQCAGCHLSQPPARAAVTEWSVRSTFPHNKHKSDPRKPRTDATCLECHTSVKTATTLANLKNPTMAGCEGCHNGKNAFKTTGFECMRCHTRAPGAAAPVNAQAGVGPDVTAMVERQE
ncbi:MAG: hypothetical protein KIT31_21905 [Deltaproteobacteria bacterium]|nr:hypothetical protein [Deltaproteobacteria bacterium]